MMKKVQQPPVPTHIHETHSRKLTPSPQTTPPTLADRLKDAAYALASQTTLGKMVMGVALGVKALPKIVAAAEPVIGEARHAYQRLRLDQLRREAQGLPPAFGARLEQLAPDLEKYEAGLNQDALSKDLDEAAYLIGEYKALGQLPTLNGLSDKVSEKYQAAFAEAVGSAEVRVQQRIIERHQLINQFYHIQEQGKKFEAPAILKQRVGELTAAGDLDNPLAEVKDQTKLLAASMGVANLTELYGRVAQVKTENTTPGVVKVADAKTAWATDQLTNHFAEYWEPQNVQTLEEVANQHNKALSSAVILDRTHYETDATRAQKFDALATMDVTDKTSWDHGLLVIRNTETDVAARELANQKRRQLDPRSGFKTAWQLEYTGAGWGGILADKTEILKTVEDLGKTFGITDLIGDTLNDNPLTRTYQAMKTSGNPFDMEKARLAEEASHLFINKFNRTDLPQEEIALKTEADWAAWAVKTDHDAKLIAAFNGVVAKAEDSLPKPEESWADKRVAFVIKANQLFGVENRAGGHATDDQVLRSHYAITANMLNVMREQYRYGISKEYAEKYLAFFNDESAPIELRRMGATVYEYYLIQHQKRDEDHRVRDAAQSAFDEVRGEANMLAVETGGEGGSIYGGNTWYDPSVYKAPNQVTSKAGELMAKVERMEATNSLLELRAKYAGEEKYGLPGMAQLLREYGGEHRNWAEKTFYVLAGWTKYRYAELDEKYNLTETLAYAAGLPVGLEFEKYGERHHGVDPETDAKIRDVNDMISEIDQAIVEVRWNNFARFQMVNQVNGHGTTFREISDVTKEAQEVIVYSNIVQDIEAMALASVATAGVGAAMGLTMRTGKLTNDLLRASKMLVRIVGRQSTFLHVNAAGKWLMRGHQDLYDFSKGYRYNLFNLGVQIVEFELMGMAHHQVRALRHLKDVAKSASTLRTVLATTAKFSHDVVRDTLFFHGWTPFGAAIRGFAHGDMVEIQGGIEALGSAEGFHHSLVLTFGLGMPIGRAPSKMAVKYALKHGIREMKPVAARQERIAAIEQQIATLAARGAEDSRTPTLIVELRQQQEQIAAHNAQVMAKLTEQYRDSEELKQQAQAMKAQVDHSRFNTATAQQTALKHRLEVAQGANAPATQQIALLKRAEQASQVRATLATRLLHHQMLPAQIAMATQLEATYIRNQRQLAENGQQIDKLERAMARPEISNDALLAKSSRLALALQKHIAFMEEVNAMSPGRFTPEAIGALVERRAVILKTAGITPNAETQAAIEILHDQQLQTLSTQAAVVRRPTAVAQQFMQVFKEATTTDGTLRKEIATVLHRHAEAMLHGAERAHGTAVEYSGVPWMDHFMTHATEAAREIFAAVRRNWSAVHSQNEAALAETISNDPQNAANAIIADIANILSWAELLQFAAADPTDIELQEAITRGAQRLQTTLESVRQLPSEIRTATQINEKDPVAAFLKAFCETPLRAKQLRTALAHIDTLTHASDKPTHYIEQLDRALGIKEVAKPTAAITMGRTLNDLWAEPFGKVESPDEWISTDIKPEEIPGATKMVQALVAARAQELGAAPKDVHVTVVGAGHNSAEVLIWLRAGAQVHVVEPEEGAISHLKRHLSLMGMRTDESSRLTYSSQKMDENAKPTADIVVWNYPRRILTGDATAFLVDLGLMPNESGPSSKLLEPQELPRGLKPGGLLVVQTDFSETYVHPFTSGDQAKDLEPVFSQPISEKKFLLPSFHLSAADSTLAIFRKKVGSEKLGLPNLEPLPPFEAVPGEGLDVAYSGFPSVKTAGHYIFEGARRLFLERAAPTVGRAARTLAGAVKGWFASGAGLVRGALPSPKVKSQDLTPSSEGKVESYSGAPFVEDLAKQAAQAVADFLTRPAWMDDARIAWALWQFNPENAPDGSRVAKTYKTGERGNNELVHAIIGACRGIAANDEMADYAMSGLINLLAALPEHSNLFRPLDRQGEAHTETVLEAHLREAYKIGPKAVVLRALALLEAKIGEPNKYRNLLPSMELARTRNFRRPGEAVSEAPLPQSAAGVTVSDAEVDAALDRPKPIAPAAKVQPIAPAADDVVLQQTVRNRNILGGNEGGTLPDTHYNRRDMTGLGSPDPNRFTIPVTIDAETGAILAVGRFPEDVRSHPRVAAIQISVHHKKIATIHARDHTQPLHPRILELLRQSLIGQPVAARKLGDPSRALPDTTGIGEAMVPRTTPGRGQQETVQDMGALLKAHGPTRLLPPYHTRLFSMTAVMQMPAVKAARTIVQELKSLLQGFSDLDAYSTGNLPPTEMHILDNRGERMLALLQDIESFSTLPPPVTGEPVASVLEGYLRVYYDSIRNKPLLEKTLQFIDDHSVTWLGKKTAYADTVRTFKATDDQRAESRNDAFDNAILLNYVRVSRKRFFGNHDNAAVRLAVQQNPALAIRALQAAVSFDLLSMHRALITSPEKIATSLLVLLRTIEKYPDMPRPDGGPPGESAVAAYLRQAYQESPRNHAAINRALKDVDALAQKLMEIDTHFFEMGAPYRRTQSVEIPQPESVWQTPPEEGISPDQGTRKFDRIFPSGPEAAPQPKLTANFVPVAPQPRTPAIVAAPDAQIQTARTHNVEILSGNHGLPTTHYSMRNFQSFSSSLGSHFTPNAAFSEIPGYVNASDGTIVALTRSLPEVLHPSAHLLLGITLRTFDPSLHPALSEVYMQLVLGDLNVHSPLPDQVRQVLQNEPAESPLHQAYRFAQQEAGDSPPTIAQFFKRRVITANAAGAPAEVSEALASLVGTLVVASKPQPGSLPPALPPLPPPLTPEFVEHRMQIFPDVRPLIEGARRLFLDRAAPALGHAARAVAGAVKGWFASGAGLVQGTLPAPKVKSQDLIPSPTMDIYQSLAEYLEGYGATRILPIVRELVGIKERHRHDIMIIGTRRLENEADIAERRAIMELQKRVLEKGKRDTVIAHGMRVDKFTLFTSTIIDGELKRGYVGLLADGDMSYQAGPHGPLYILLDRNRSVFHEDRGQENFGYDNWTYPRDSHRAYLVPTENIRRALVESIESAVTKGVMPAAEAEIAKSKIITYEEYLAREEQSPLLDAAHFDETGHTPSLVGTIPGLTPELEMALISGGYLRSIEGKYKGVRFPNPDVPFQEVDPKLGESLLKISNEWVKRSGFQKSTPEMEGQALQSLQWELAPHTIDFRARPGTPADAYKLLAELITVCPKHVLQNGAIQHISIGEDPDTYHRDEAGLYINRGINIYKNPINDGRAGMAFTFLHEVGHAVEETLTADQRSTLESAYAIITKSGTAPLIPESTMALAAMGGVAGRASRKINIFSEFIAETHATYTLAGNFLRAEIRKIEDPEVRAAYETVYHFFKEIHGEREFGMYDDVRALANKPDVVAAHPVVAGDAAVAASAAITGGVASHRHLRGKSLKVKSQDLTPS